MGYWLRMERRDYIRDQEQILENQTSYLNPERYDQIWGEEENVGPDGLPEVPITDPRVLDHWYDSLARSQGMTGAEAERIFATPGVTGTPEAGPNSHMLLGYAEGSGRRV